ncbi:MAG: putative glycoside hydrolase [Planctomycetes bacterium]|jgi:hypothetical protein|nr:putative glycoside hydrolase [Planctomycetota bacterium]
MLKSRLKFFSFFLLINALLIFLFPNYSLAYRQKKETFPKLANYFIRWEIQDNEVKELAKWDLLILDMEVQENSRENLQKIREHNPNIVILAYITSQDIYDLNSNPYSYLAHLRKELAAQISDKWWLKDVNGNKTSYWPGTYLLNTSDNCGLSSSGQHWNEFLPEFISKRIVATGLWDGVFFDNIWGGVAWVNPKIDIDNDGQADDAKKIDKKWSDGVKKMLQKMRELNGDSLIIMGNGGIFYPYQEMLNGMMFENFPSPWENGGTWSGSMVSYFNLQNVNKKPNTTVVNTYAKDQNNYQKMRHGLTSTLLNDGYYSFDYDVTNHGQIWWYDEYGINLGKAQDGMYNLLNKDNPEIKSGLWRRDFEKGTVIVNSTKKEQSYSFAKEEFEKIKGTQDTSVNKGNIVNWIKLAPNDGVILFKRTVEIKDSAFTNGYFTRIFSFSGTQKRSGFFAYSDRVKAEAKVILSDVSGSREIITALGRQITITRAGKKISQFLVFDKKYKAQVSLAAFDINKDGKKEIIVGAGKGDSGDISIYNSSGKLLNTFSAYGKNFRGGVNVAVNNKGEILVGTITGGPQVRVFSATGKLVNAGFFAHDKNNRNGVSVASGDVNNDGQEEIITVTNLQGRGEVAVFNNSNKLLKRFNAYDKDLKGQINVLTNDVDNDGQKEILTTINNF